MMSDNVPGLTGVLTGWKAIAVFLKRDQRTAMRWASERGLPVRRVPGGKRGSVYAVPAEITEWLTRGVVQVEAAGNDAGRNGSDPREEVTRALETPAACEIAAAPTAAPRSRFAALWSATVLAAAMGGAALAAGSIELGLLSVGSAAGRTLTPCHGAAAPR